MTYRVWWIPQIPMEPFTVDVSDLRTATLLTDVLADYDLFQWEHRVKPDYSNAGGVQTKDEDGEWVDLDDQEIEELLIVEDPS